MYVSVSCKSSLSAKQRLMTQGNFENGDSCLNCLDRGLSCSRPFPSRRRKNTKPHHDSCESTSRMDWIRGNLEPFQPEDHTLNIMPAPGVNSSPRLDETMLGLRHGVPRNLDEGFTGLLQPSLLEDQASATPSRDSNIQTQQNISQGDRSTVPRVMSQRGEPCPLQVPEFTVSSDTTNTTQTPLFVSDQHSLRGLLNPEPPHSNPVQTDLDDAMQKSSIWSSKMVSLSNTRTCSVVAELADS